MKHTILGVGCLLLMGLSWHVGAFDEDDLKKLKATNECLKCDLSGVNLKGAYLYAENLTRANLTGANLTRAWLSGVNLTDANLTGADLTDAENFNTANTTGAKFCKTVMPDGSTNNSGC